MAVKKGISGKVMISSNTVAEVKSWTMSLGMEKEDTTYLGASGRTYEPTFYSATGSIVCSYDPTDTNGQVVLRSAALAGTDVTLLLYEDGTHYFSVVAMVDMELSVEATGIEGATFNFTSSGAISYN